MKKRLIVLLVAILLAAGTASCGTSENVGLAYTDTDNAYYIYISEPGWAYYIYDDGTVMFYDEDKSDGITGFAISSTSAEGLSQSEITEGIETMWSDTVAYFVEYTTTYEWYQNEDFVFGDYSATMYSFSGEFTSYEGEIYGDYFFWADNDLIYICSFAAYPEDYDEYFAIFEESMENFEPLTD